MKTSHTFSLEFENLNEFLSIAEEKRLNKNKIVNDLVAAFVENEKPKMLKCPVCGAEYASVLGRCPSCAQNRIRAQEEKERAEQEATKLLLAQRESVPEIDYALARKLELEKFTEVLLQDNVILAKWEELKTAQPAVASAFDQRLFDFVNLLCDRGHVREGSKAPVVSTKSLFVLLNGGLDSNG